MNTIDTTLKVGQEITNVNETTFKISVANQKGLILSYLATSQLIKVTWEDYNRDF